jgi:uncharacterized RmlC-like cupin family protein
MLDGGNIATHHMYRSTEGDATPELRIIQTSKEEIGISSGAMACVGGISDSLTSATGTQMEISTMQISCSSSARVHFSCDSALYVNRGRDKFLVGENLDQDIEFGTAGYPFPPIDTPLQSVNGADKEIVGCPVRNTYVETMQEYSPRGGA